MDPLFKNLRYDSQIKQEVIEFAQELVRIRSFSGQEEKAIKLTERKMLELGYDDVKIDSMGNLIGSVGSGDTLLMFDSHIDTVEVTDEAKWDAPAFGGDIIDGHLFGRGSVDMKSSIAASIYGGAIAKKKGCLEGKKVVVSCTVHEEYCDGVNLKHLFSDFKIKPDFMVICEPSNNVLTLGHKGKAQIVIKTLGNSAHAAEPWNGSNAIYEMTEIIQRIEMLNTKLASSDNSPGSVIISDIKSKSASLNAVPTECEIYIDRRLTMNESLEQVKAEMDYIVQGKNAFWEIGTLYKMSWTGKPIIYTPFHEPWEISKNHKLTLTCMNAYAECFGENPENFDFWNFSTNAVTPIEMGIPCIGFGPGDYTLAHMRNERCHVGQIMDACIFYACLIKNVQS